MSFDDFAAARVVHVVAVVGWIGGVWFVTAVLMPAIAATRAADERVSAFHIVEGRFAGHARLWVALAGASGLWMIWRGDLWSRFTLARFWWMHAMVALWLVFALMLFVIEPLFLHRRMAASPDPARDFARMMRMHWVLSLAAAVTVIGAVAGSHGLI
ncbi:MAG: hypothetical protein JF593_07490 [Novosphingobium sp.]|nr:hypothetical protein [Novosphingobium sp.]